jgi:hypothetical protein
MLVIVVIIVILSRYSCIRPSLVHALRHSADIAGAARKSNAIFESSGN